MTVDKVANGQEAGPFADVARAVKVSLAEPPLRLNGTWVIHRGNFVYTGHIVCAKCARSHRNGANRGILGRIPA